MNADPDLTKAFQELHVKKTAATQQMDSLENKIAAMGRGIRMNQLTRAYINQQAPESRLYRIIGRAYFINSKNSMDQTLENGIKKFQDNMKNLEESKAVIQKNLKEAENTIRELVAKKKQQMSA